MTKKLRFLMTALLICVCGMTWAEEETLTSTFTDKDLSVGDGELEWTASPTASSFEGTNLSRGVAFTASTSITSKESIENVKKVVVVVSTNGASNTLSVKVGSTTLGSTVTLNSGDRYREVTFETTNAVSGNVVISITRSNKSIWIQSISVTHEVSGVEKKDNELSFDKSEITIEKGKDFTAPTLNNPNSLSVTYESSAPSIASVDANSGEVTIHEVGETTISAIFDGNDEYKAGSASYTITVKAAKENAEKPANALFFDAFNNTEGTGGHDGKYSGTISTSTIVEDEDDNWKTIDEKCGGAFQCVKFGSSSAFGTLTTKAIELTGEGTLTFSAAGWGDSNSNTLKIEAEGADVYGDTEITLENGVWNNYTVNIINAEGAVTITFSGKRGFIDDVLVVEVIPTTVPVNIPASGWASYCSKYDVESTGECYMATKLVNGKVTIVPVEGTIKAGTGMLVKGSGSVELAVAATAPEAYADMTDNKLVGVLEATSLDGKQCYILSDGAFYPCTGGTLAAGKAYLDIAPANAKVIDIDLNGDETAISTVNAEQQNGNIYTINGVQVKNTQLKGIYIINGKKVVK